MLVSFCISLQSSVIVSRTLIPPKQLCLKYKMTLSTGGCATCLNRPQCRHWTWNRPGDHREGFWCHRRYGWPLTYLIETEAENSNKELHIRCIQLWVRSTTGKLSGTGSIHNIRCWFIHWDHWQTPSQRTHGYADDTKICLSFRVHSLASQDVTLRNIENCVADIRAWMLSDRLLINDTKN